MRVLFVLGHAFDLSQGRQHCLDYPARWAGCALLRIHHRNRIFTGWVNIELVYAATLLIVHNRSHHLGAAIVVRPYNVFVRIPPTLSFMPMKYRGIDASHSSPAINQVVKEDVPADLKSHRPFNHGTMTPVVSLSDKDKLHIQSLAHCEYSVTHADAAIPANYDYVRPELDERIT